LGTGEFGHLEPGKRPLGGGCVLPRLSTRSRLRRQCRCHRPEPNARKPHVVHWVRIEGVVRELYDVDGQSGVTRSSSTGVKTDEVKRVISIEAASESLSPRQRAPCPPLTRRRPCYHFGS
jgi:hypothetical protein